MKSSVAEQITKQQESQKYYHERRSKERVFEVGQSMLIENVRGEPTCKWLPGTIIDRTGTMSYRVQVDASVWR